MAFLTKLWDPQNLTFASENGQTSEAREKSFQIFSRLVGGQEFLEGMFTNISYFEKKLKYSNTITKETKETPVIYEIDEKEETDAAS